MISFLVTGYLINLLAAFGIYLIIGLSLDEKDDVLITHIFLLESPVRNHLVIYIPFFSGIHCFLFLINYFKVKDSTYRLIERSSFTFF